MKPKPERRIKKQPSHESCASDWGGGRLNCALPLRHRLPPGMPDEKLHGVGTSRPGNSQPHVEEGNPLSGLLCGHLQTHFFPADMPRRMTWPGGQRNAYGVRLRSKAAGRKKLAHQATNCSSLHHGAAQSTVKDGATRPRFKK